MVWGGSGGVGGRGGGDGPVKNMRQGNIIILHLNHLARFM